FNCSRQLHPGLRLQTGPTAGYTRRTATGSARLDPPKGRFLTLRVLRPFARLVMAVLLALDLARIPGEHSRFSPRGTQALRGFEQRPRYPVAHGVRLRGNSATAHADDHVIVALGFGELERLQNSHPGGVARKVVFQRARVDRDRAVAGQHAHPRDRGLAFTCGPNGWFFFGHRSFGTSIRL